MKKTERVQGAAAVVDSRDLINLPAGTRIERTELGVYVGKWLRRGFLTKRANHLAPLFARRVDARQLGALDPRPGVRFEPPTLASSRGNLRTDETLLCVEELSFPTKEGGRVLGDVSISFRLIDDSVLVAGLLNAGILQQISIELPRRLREILSAEVGRWAQRDVIENLLPIRDNTLAALSREIGPDAAKDHLGLGLQLINVTVILRTPDLYRASGARGPDLIADLARAREAMGTITSKADERAIAQMFDGIIRQHLLRTLNAGRAKIFVVPTEATGLLGNFQDIERMAGNDDDSDGPQGDGPPLLLPPEGEAA
ncbi:hypothetical protein [Parvularcula marina]|uniref:hypothetical protein n=1 Tax=Parvularcula marina TaxID=2292771 RepID=UPI0011C0754E|nr:hypothetical protein [Parvularcula marina]